MTNLMLFLSQEWLLVATLLILVTLFALYEMRRAGQAISVHELTNLVNQKDAVVVDLRETKDYRAGHIVEAVNFPHNTLNDKLSELEQYKDKPMILVDKMGQHSGHAGRVLKGKGFDIVRLRGGLGLHGGVLRGDVILAALVTMTPQLEHLFA